ncbi:hypothetical protein K1719_008808 [Acacia pycnantha]|nr:hypothetical protein K1719_008808 [Acacia pycnantha]
MSLAIFETAVLSATLFFCRGLYGYIFSNEKEVVDYVAVMAPLVCLSVILTAYKAFSQGLLEDVDGNTLGFTSTLEPTIFVAFPWLLL